MEEIAQQFSEELQELLDRYRTRLSIPRIMHVAQGIFYKTLSIRYHPELHQKAINNYMDKLVQVIGNACVKPGDEQIENTVAKTLTSNIRRQCDEM